MNKLMLTISIFIIFNSSFAIASEISEFDVATYVLTGKNGQPTNMQMRLSQNKGKWIMEGREAPGAWKNINCDKGCEYRASTKHEEDKYLASFPKSMQEKFEIACIQNTVQAFCRLTKKDDPKKGGYALVALVTGKPTPMSLQRLPKQ
jgi:hypothetical protein